MIIMDQPNSETKTPAYMMPNFGLQQQNFVQPQMLYNPMASLAAQQLLSNPSKQLKAETPLNLLPMASLYGLTGANMLPNYNALKFPLQANFGDMIQPLPLPNMSAVTQNLKTPDTKPVLPPSDTAKVQVTESPKTQVKKRAKSAGGKTTKKRRRVSVKLCNIEGCTKLARSTTLFCAAHGGGRRCLTPNCTKAARGATSYCIAHGGGRRCKHPMCSKSAQGSTYFCISHGGGRRCKNPECTKSARGPAGYCKAHGGGRKCAHADCSKSAAEGAEFCRPHGGGVKCKKQGCPRTVKKNQLVCSEHRAELQNDSLKNNSSTLEAAPKALKK